MNIIINKRSFTSTVINTSYSYLTLGGLFYFNYHFIGGSYIVNAIILVILISDAMIKNKRYVTSYKVEDSKINQILEIINGK